MEGKDLRDGIRCLLDAYREFDSAEAAELLGKAYATGNGVPRHAGIAAAWARHAAMRRSTWTRVGMR